MSKKNKSKSQSPKGKKSKNHLNNNGQQFERNNHNNGSQFISETLSTSPRVQPEQTSLDAHQHIQQYLKSCGKASLEQEDLNAVLRLSQHLRVFGLVSAVGYINQSNHQQGRVRERTVPVWQSLLGQLLVPDNPPEGKELMEKVIEMSGNYPSQYIAIWRQSLILSNHWNFWARAYQEE
ncbi:MAG: hypothetical protein BRC40_10650 [Cyanobacteria bacterium QH_8_48_120]|jgi:hypothetical protein|nr:MAG: hypothetical protein BRC40_10650 [Cyanobacteria bacterium QH_8_48_120]